MRVFISPTHSVIRHFHTNLLLRGSSLLTEIKSNCITWHKLLVVAAEGAGHTLQGTQGRYLRYPQRLRLQRVGLYTIGIQRRRPVGERYAASEECLLVNLIEIQDLNHHLEKVPRYLNYRWSR